MRRRMTSIFMVVVMIATVFAVAVPEDVSADGNGSSYTPVLVYETTEDYVRSFTVFNGYLYATTEEQDGSTAGKVYRSADGKNWEVAKDFGYRVYCSAAFNGHLYVGLSDSQGIWRSSDGINFVQVHIGLTNYAALKPMGNYLYAGGHINKIERSSDGVSWTQVHNSGNVQEFAELNGKFYGASWNPLDYLYSSPDGISWGIDANYPGSSATDTISSSTGILFVAALNKLYKTTDGFTWSQVSVPVSGDLGVRYHELAELNSEIYFPFGTSIYKTTDGSSWTFVAEDPSWGDIDSMGVFNNNIYFGTSGLNNGKIYRLTDSAPYLPLPFFDDFEDGDIDNWNDASDTYGTIRLETGNLDGTGDYYLYLDSPPEPDNQARAILENGNNPDWKNYVLEFDTKIDYSSGSYAYINTFFYLQSTTNIDNGYYLHMRALQDSITLFKRENGINIELTTIPMQINIGTTYHIKVIVNDGTILQYIDGAKIIDFYDSTFTYGTIGFSTHGAGAETVRSAFDNIHITPTVLSPKDLKQDSITELEAAKTGDKPSNWWDSSWECRKVIYLGENIGIPRYNEPVELKIDFSGQQKSDFSDVRVVDSRGQEIPYHLYNIVENSVNIVFLADAQPNTIETYYVYYGNPDANAPGYPIPTEFVSSLSGDTFTAENSKIKIGNQGRSDLELVYYKPYSPSADWSIGDVSDYGGWNNIHWMGDLTTDPADAYSHLNPPDEITITKNPIFMEIMVNFTFPDDRQWQEKYRFYPDCNYWIEFVSTMNNQITPPNTPYEPKVQDNLYIPENFMDNYYLYKSEGTTDTGSVNYAVDGILMGTDLFTNLTSLGFYGNEKGVGCVPLFHINNSRPMEIRGGPWNQGAFVKVIFGHGDNCDFVNVGATTIFKTATIFSSESTSADNLNRLKEISVALKNPLSITIKNGTATKTCDKKIDKIIDHIIKHIENSLDDKLWIDDNHLNPDYKPRGRCWCRHKRYGEDVFVEEKKAVEIMMWTSWWYNWEISKLEKTIAWMKERGWNTSRLEAELLAMQTAVSTFEEVIDKLVTADKILAQTAIDEAPDGWMKDKAQIEFQRALKDIEIGRPDWAIWHFKKAWKYAQDAMDCGAENK